jgi:dTDP-4-dehydrorhamnose 3,5-epimerase
MGKFEFIKNNIEGLLVIRPTVFGDDRGFFMETYQKREFSAAGIDKEFLQDNHSKSTKGVLRGLHFQKENTQGKLVRVISGSVFDVAVDCRPNSKTFGKWYGVNLTDENKLQFYIPEGFAHGFLVLSDEAEFVYKCTDFYNKSAEGGIPYDDAQIAIDWPKVDCEIKLSEKDKRHTPFEQQNFDYFRKYGTK